MHILLTRTNKNEQATLGDLSIDGRPECHTLEDRVREVSGQPVASWKVQGATAIPIGTYQVVIDFSNRFQRLMPHLLDVPGFTGIRIHKGNTDKDTEGCILLGMIEDGADHISQSTVAFDAFFPKLQDALAGEQEVYITVQ